MVATIHSGYTVATRCVLMVVKFRIGSNMFRLKSKFTFSAYTVTHCDREKLEVEHINSVLAFDLYEEYAGYEVQLLGVLSPTNSIA